MEHDLLKQFRGTPSDKVLAGPTRVTYQAFKKADTRQHRLKLRPSLRAWQRVNYDYLQRIVEDGIFGTQIGLVFSFSVVIIKGRNLLPIADAIDAQLCEYVQQFDAERWEMPPADDKAPFVESMEIHVQTKVEASDELLSSIAAAQQAERIRQQLKSP